MKFSIFLENKRCADFNKEIEPIFNSSWSAYWRNTLKSDSKKIIINNIEKYRKGKMMIDVLVTQPEFQWENADMIKWVVQNLEYCKRSIHKE